MTAAGTPALFGSTAAASAIGHRICQDAIWYEGRCNWVGAEPLELDSKQFAAPAYRSLGPDTYAGTSGVAVFLGELAAVTGDVAARNTARGAIQHALTHADDVPPILRVGLFSGWTGIAAAAFRVGSVLGEPEWQERALALAQRGAQETLPGEQFDVISGRAGAIVGYLRLWRIADRPSLLDVAIRLADELVASAMHDQATASWASPDVRTIRNLTGFSHGTAGAAYALLEIYAATANSSYREAANLALRYERRWFSKKEQNWPDFREDPFSGRRWRRRPVPFPTLWCHGAPGIAMARLRAYEALHDRVCLEEALAALSTTRTAVRATLEAGTGNYSLCHGLCGNAEALLYASRLVDVDAAENAELCHAVARQGVERHVAEGHAWPCGTHTGETPNLMLGLAGIGLFYLRLEHSTVPSILIIRP